MNESYKLELSFAPGDGGTKKINIQRPTENLTEAEVLPVMQKISESGLFLKEGVNQYANVKRARYVRTAIEDILEVEE